VSHGYKGASVAERDTAAALLDKAHALPVRGQHVGSRARLGPPIADTWDGNGPVPLGWSSYRAHRNDPSETVWLPEPETASKLARLTGPERAALAQIRASTVPHDPEPENAKEIER
jgi:hypothetical protein